MPGNNEHMMKEADIGSGEKKPEDAETQKMIEQISDRDLNSSAPPEKPAKPSQAQNDKS